MKLMTIIAALAFSFAVNAQEHGAAPAAPAAPAPAMKAEKHKKGKKAKKAKEATH